MAASGTDTWSFHCTACGKCCNSPPQMSVPELFHHQHRFIGCLAVRRVPLPKPGDPLGGVASGSFTEADARAFSLLAEALLHRAGTTHVLLATQAFGSGACPALGDDMRCTVHGDRKPAACAVVPLDALVPDRLQHVVLAERRQEAAYLGADCLTPGARPGAPPLTRRLAVVDPGASEALARRRREIMADKRLWGDAVFQMVRRELFDEEGARSRIPVNGSVVLSIAPVLAVLAAASPRSRERCLAYLDAQIALLEAREPSAGAQARAFLHTNQVLRRALERAPPRATPGREKDVEAWMGLA